MTANYDTLRKEAQDLLDLIQSSPMGVIEFAARDIVSKQMEAIEELRGLMKEQNS